MTHIGYPLAQEYFFKFQATLSLLIGEKDIINIIILNNKFKQLKIGHRNLCIFPLIQDKSGKISLAELREVCIQFNLPVEPELLESLFSYCDVDGDGQINYEEFANFLNWKDKMPSGEMQSTLKEETSEEEVKVRVTRIQFLLTLSLVN